MADVALVATKLNPPPVQRELVPRPRLIDRLNQGLGGKLTLVATPAGYGKTMLLSAWAAQCQIPVAWVSLDEGDNDPARFLSYLIAALERTLPGLRSTLPSLLHSPHVPPEDALLPGLLNEIVRARQPFIVILDDYHLISEPEVHNHLIYLLDHLPPQMHLVVASRSDPPLQIARLRARSELTELRLADLCFTLDEAAQFFRHVMHLDLQQDQVAALTARTEGWIAGLQMAAISVKGATNPSGFIRSFSGSNRFILDYLVEEVLRGQTEEIQAFLLQTSILNRLSGPLCDAVTGLNNGQALLERLERTNLFIIPLDEERSWFRYHQLFRDLLRKRAQERWRCELAGWQRRASLWCETQGDLQDAIEYALAAGDFGRAAHLVEAVAQPVLLRSQIHTFRGWICQLPEVELATRPDLILYQAWALVLGDAPNEAVEAWLGRVDVTLESTAAKVGVIRGYREIMQGGVMRAMALLQQALPRLPAEATLFRSVSEWVLSLFYVLTGDFRAGSQALDGVVRMGVQQKHPIIAAGALCALAEIRLRLGQLHAAQADYERALEIARDDTGHLPIAARALMGLGDLWREWNDLERAARCCTEGIELAKYLRESTAIAGYITLAFIQHAMGAVDLSQEAMQKAWELARQTEHTGLDDLYVRLYRARLEIMQGDLEATERWLQDRDLTSRFDPADLGRKDNYYQYHILKYELLVAARWLIAADRPQDALNLLMHLLAKMEEQGRVHLVIECLLLSARAYWKLGNRVQAMNSFERALVLAEPGGYVRAFLDEGPGVGPLLQEASRVENVSRSGSWRHGRPKPVRAWPARHHRNRPIW